LLVLALAATHGEPVASEFVLLAVADLREDQRSCLEGGGDGLWVA